MPNSIENNAYRILGLDTTASQKDILKRYKEIFNRLKIDDYPEYDLDIILPKHLRNESTVTDALKRLQSQKSNLKEYFFWFQISDKIDEKALRYLQNNELTNAIQTWKNASKINNSIAYFYKKNLALLYCLLLSEKNNPTYLKDSLSVWHEIVNSDKFWIAFLKSYNSNNDQTISSEILSKFKNDIVSQISDIYTDLHKHHKDNKYVKDFQEIFGTHGEKTEKGLLNPIYQSIYDNIEDLQKIKIEENKKVSEKDIKSINKIVDDIKVDLDKLKEIGSYNDTQSRVVRDHAAEGLKSISVDLHNHAGEFEESMNLLKTAVRICGTDSLKNILNSELDKIEKNPNIHCWFCNAILKKSDEEYSLEEKWHQVTNRERDFLNNTTVTFQKYNLVIPRCKECKSAHVRRTLITSLRVMGSIATGAGFFRLFQNQFDNIFIFSLIATGVCYGTLTFFNVGGKLIPLNTKPSSYKSEYPVYKELVKNGWQRGEEPT